MTFFVCQNKDLYSRKDMNLTGQKTLPTIWGTYMKLVNDWYLGQIFSLYTCNYGFIYLQLLV